MYRSILLATLIAASAASAEAFDFTDEAQVVAATPIYETINQPTQDCWNDAGAPVTTTRTYIDPPGRSYGGAAIGGVAGGVLGNQMGSGNGRIATTAAGAAVGAIAGDQIDNGTDQRSYLGSVIGGVAGGLLGSTIGHGNGRAAAAAVGAVGGALLGDRIDNRDRYRSRYVETYQQQPMTSQLCRSTDNYRQVVTGYTVLYRYNGREAETVLPYKPGPTIRLGIGPADGARTR
jgi:uncharacterized protein YcfJ